MRANETSIQAAKEALSGKHGDSYLRILELFAVKGIADAKQLRENCGLESKVYKDVFERLTRFIDSFPPALQLSAKTYPRAGKRGRAPYTYFLTEAGAALLRASGYPDAQPSNMQGNDHAIEHVHCIVDGYLSARRNGLEVSADKVISFRGTETIRPDLQVKMPDGTIQIVEFEQEAKTTNSSRISDSLAQKLKFFVSPESANYRKDIRMVVNIQPGFNFQKTCNVWLSRVKILMEKSSDPLNFRLFAISLTDFEAEPEWEIEPSTRWLDITQLAAAKKRVRAPAQFRVEDQVTQNSKEDLILLSALQMVLQEEKEDQWKSSIDFDFLDVMVKIYETSHPEDRKSLLYMMPPRGSIAMLKDHLNLHPLLRKMLWVSIHSNTAKWSWNYRTIQYRILLVIDTFLAFYGWTSNPYLSVKVEFAEGSSQSFKIKVGSVGFFWGPFEESRKKLDALEWVLTALLKYAQELGLGRPKFL